MEEKRWYCPRRKDIPEKILKAHVLDQGYRDTFDNMKELCLECRYDVNYYKYFPWLKDCPCQGGY